MPFMDAAAEKAGFRRSIGESLSGEDQGQSLKSGRTAATGAMDCSRRSGLLVRRPFGQLG